MGSSTLLLRTSHIGANAAQAAFHQPFLPKPSGRELISRPPNQGSVSCATNSPTKSGPPSNRCFRTSRAVWPAWTTEERHLWSYGQAHLGDLPEEFGAYTTCYNRFVRWRRAGVRAEL